MALFNTPLNPQEDHTEQAVWAALRIQTRLAAYPVSYTHLTLPTSDLV